MDQANEKEARAQDAVELFRMYPMWLKRLKTLNWMVEQAEILCDHALIEQYALRRSPIDGMPVSKGVGSSKTENLALALDEIRSKEKKEQAIALDEWMHEIKVLQMNITLYEIVVETLTEEEQTFIKLHFQNGYSLRRLAAGDVPKDNQSIGLSSLYRLRRMKQVVLAKAAIIIDS